MHEISVVNSKLVKSKEVDGDWGNKWLSTNDAGSGAFVLVTGSKGAAAFVLAATVGAFEPAAAWLVARATMFVL